MLLFIFVGRRLLSEPLSQMAKEAERIDLDNLHHVDIKIKENNELKTVETAMNDMIDNIQSALKKREEAEEQVKELNKNLESKVEKRTAELRLANEQLEESMQELKKTQQLTFLFRQRRL